MLRVEGTRLDRLFWEEPVDELIAAINTIVPGFWRFLPYLYGCAAIACWYHRVSQNAEAFLFTSKTHDGVDGFRTSPVTVSTDSQ